MYEYLIVMKNRDVRLPDTSLVDTGSMGDTENKQKKN